MQRTVAADIRRSHMSGTVGAMQHISDTRTRLLDAAEKIICEAHGSLEISVRRITAEAGVNVAAVNYHFGSLERLAVATGQRVYHRLNAARLNELQAAVDRAAPATPAVADILRALIGTSVRWSLDPTSPYAVFQYLNRLTSMSDTPEIFRDMVNDVASHRIFADYLGRAAPWFDSRDIAWRLAAALGVRSQFTRHHDRNSILTGQAMTAIGAEELIDELCTIMAPMFARGPDGVGSRSIALESRRSNSI